MKTFGDIGFAVFVLIAGSSVRAQLSPSRPPIHKRLSHSRLIARILSKQNSSICMI